MTTVVPVELSDAALAADVVDGLALVEEGLREAARAQHELLAETSRYLIDAGGKRFRATLVLLAAQFGNPRDERIVPAAVAIELTHLATLYHDDVMDEAAVRRGSPSANFRWDNTISILTGDFLFARASQILADLGTDAIRIQAATFSRLVSGQIAETVGPAPGEDPLAHYLSVVTQKTASLIATAGQFGAMFSEAPQQVIDRIRRPARRSGWPSSSRTTSSTWRASRRNPAKHRGQTCGRGYGPCRCCMRCARPTAATPGWSNCSTAAS